MTKKQLTGGIAGHTATDKLISVFKCSGWNQVVIGTSSLNYVNTFDEQQLRYEKKTSNHFNVLYSWWTAFRGGAWTQTAKPAVQASTDT